MINRRSFALATLATCAVPALASKSLVADGKEKRGVCLPTAVEPQVFEFGKEVEVDLKSVPAKWKGKDIHLLELAKVTFSVDSETNQLKAVALGSKKTFDNVEYQVGVAVFGSEDTMLGTAKAICTVQRIWMGVYATQPVRLEFDFGTSRNFSKATKFLVSISDEKVLTPDAWQK